MRNLLVDADRRDVGEAAPADGPAPLRLHLDDLRSLVNRATTNDALARLSGLCERLSDIMSRSSCERSIDSLYRTRQACVEYLEALSSGRASLERKKAALICIDILETRLPEDTPISN